jgi:hypothetical protein
MQKEEVVVGSDAQGGPEGKLPTGLEFVSVTIVIFAAGQRD